MTYDSRAIANWFIDKARSKHVALTPMKLQKLVYIAHGWSLGLRSQNLIHDPVEAWKWGPVIRSLYREFRDLGAGEIDRKASVTDGATLEDRDISIDDYATADDKEWVKSLLAKIWDVYGGLTAAQLSDMTHREGTPWHTMFKRMGDQILPYTVIPNDIIDEHYKKLADGQRTAAINT